MSIIRACYALLLCCLPFAAAVAENAYIGRKACATCHQQQNQLWMGSHHDLAMQEASADNVLGNFADVRFLHHGVESRFYTSKGRFMVRSDGADGKLYDYPIKYTFGFYPLQQYIIEFPQGKLQVLDIAWDSRPPDQGGQRWMHLHPEDKISHDDVLHWTGPNLNWNYMCADCHSTNLQKNYHADTASYQSTWAELDVSCEACHGPGQRHQLWTRKKPQQQKADSSKGLVAEFRKSPSTQWRKQAQTGSPQVTHANQAEIAICARCHSRRMQMAEDHLQQPLMDAYVPALLTSGLYHADGQILEEVFVYGSFLQSKMYQHGVTCSDCHDPHSTLLKQPGDQVCYQCHSQERYASQQHHFHSQESMGSACVECHMPATTYMQVDARHDHSFRIPRPDLSVTLGTPNACNQCHEDKSVEWAAAQFKQWYGDHVASYQQYAEILQAARTQSPDAAKKLQALVQQSSQPVIARATALQELQYYPDAETLALIDKNLSAKQPLLRRSALSALRQFDLRIQAARAFSMLQDPVRAVRLEASSLLHSIPPGQLSAQQKQLFDQAIQEYIEAQRFNAERPEAQVNLGNVYASQGKTAKAEAAYEQAIHLQQHFVPAYVNLARFYSTQAREQDAEMLLRQGLMQVPQSSDLNHALGLSLVRQKKHAKALEWLAKAVVLEDTNVRYGYVYAVALNSEGKIKAGIKQLQRLHQLYPGNVDVLYALVTFNRDAGDAKAALQYLQKLRRQVPENQQLQYLQLELSRMN